MQKAGTRDIFHGECENKGKEDNANITAEVNRSEGHLKARKSDGRTELLWCDGAQSSGSV